MHLHSSRPLILIAEDNDTNRKVIMLQLQLLSLSAEAVPDGNAAFQYWQSGRFALLLTDLNMPEMDGFALARAIRATEAAGQRMPIVAVTASAAIDQQERCGVAGIDACLTKPVRLGQLRDTLAQWLPQTRLPTAPVTTTEALAAPPGGPVDLRVLENLVGCMPATIDGVLQAFLASSGRAQDQMHAALASDCAASLASAAHRLKSAARSIGALQLGSICHDIEAAAFAAGTDGPPTSTALQSFNAELAAVQQFIRTRA